jgi:hypothetical protein
MIVLALSGCSAPPPPVAMPAPEVAPIPAFPADLVWTREPETVVRRPDGSGVSLPYIFTRLEVVGVDSVGLVVRCATCFGAPEGYVEKEAILHEELPPEVAAWGSLDEFALAVRGAAQRGELDRLRPIMAPDFSHSFVGIQTPEGAFSSWESEQFSSLAAVPDLLDRGLATRDGRIWSAPPDFVERWEFRGLRLGFRQRVDGRWEWLYLIRSVTE